MPPPMDPDGTARGALKQILEAVRVHVDLDPLYAVTFRALHGEFSCYMICIIFNI